MAEKELNRVYNIPLRKGFMKAPKQIFESKCSQCHDLSLVADVPPGSADDAGELVSRMVDEGLEATEGELAQIVRHLTETYVKIAE